MPLWAEFLHSLCSFPACVTSYFSPFPTCVCGWWSNMSIWISWVEVDGVLDILLFCTIDLTFGNLFSVSSALGWCRQAHLFFFFFSGRWCRWCVGAGWSYDGNCCLPPAYSVTNWRTRLFTPPSSPQSAATTLPVVAFKVKFFQRVRVGENVHVYEH